MTRFDLVLAAVSISLFTALAPLSATAAKEPQKAPGTAAADTSAAERSPAGTSTAAPLTNDEMEVLVAPIALYPDELVAVISQASLYPLQIVAAERYLTQVSKDKNLKPGGDWDGSVISLLNYPDVVKMMSLDLDWTQRLGNAITYQQKDVLVAIQQLRDEAVAKKIIKTDDKIKVTEEGGNVVIHSANPQAIYVPQYEPQMLYVEDYPVEPVTYSSEGYEPYWYPTAPYFAAAVTGLVWAAAIDWNDWGVWGGRWGNDIDIDCKNCFNDRNFNGRVNFNDVDWRNIDRSKIDIDSDQLAKFDQSRVRNSLDRDSANNLRNKTSSIKRQRAAAANTDKASNVGDVRKSTLEGLKKQQAGAGKAAKLDQAANRPGGKVDAKRPGNKANANRPSSGKTAANKPSSGKASANRPSKKGANANRSSSGKVKPAGRVDNRPRNPSGLGNVGSGKSQKIASNRGAQSMGGGARGGGRSFSAGGGGRQMGGGGRGRGGGGGGGGRGRR